MRSSTFRWLTTEQNLTLDANVRCSDFHPSPYRIKTAARQRAITSFHRLPEKIFRIARTWDHRAFPCLLTKKLSHTARTCDNWLSLHLLIGKISHSTNVQSVAFFLATYCKNLAHSTRMRLTAFPRHSTENKKTPAQRDHSIIVFSSAVYRKNLTHGANVR